MNRVESGREDVIHVNKTHGEMVRFEGPEDEDWKKVKRVLVEVAGSLGEKSPTEGT